MEAEPPTEDQLIIETKCEWCWISGLKSIDIETVRTASSTAERCIDRDACRARAMAKLRQ